MEKKAVALCVFSDDVDDTVKESEVQKLHCAGSGSGEGAGGGLHAVCFFDPGLNRLPSHY